MSGSLSPAERIKYLVSERQKALHADDPALVRQFNQMLLETGFEVRKPASPREKRTDHFPH